MSKIKKTKIILELEESSKKELRHVTSALDESNVASNRLAETILLDGSSKDIDVGVKAASSTGDEIKSDSIKSESHVGPDTSSVGQSGKATKNKEKKSPDLVIRHKFK